MCVCAHVKNLKYARARIPHSFLSLYTLHVTHDDIDLKIVL